MDRAQVFTVTHPFHPLFGREFALVERRKAWGENRVYYHDEAGDLRRIPAPWTSLATADAFVTTAAGRSSLRLEDLLKLVALIEQQLGKRTTHRGKRVSSK
ncbi:MAG: Y4bD/Y4pK family protein [Aquimonas sp.]|nr:Y4bD/Y4pK family protein [Aquimonas sp.]